MEGMPIKMSSFNIYSTFLTENLVLHNNFKIYDYHLSLVWDKAEMIVGVGVGALRHEVTWKTYMNNLVQYYTDEYI